VQIPKATVKCVFNLTYWLRNKHNNWPLHHTCISKTCSKSSNYDVTVF